MFRGWIGSRLVYLSWLLVAIRLLFPIAIPNPLMNALRPIVSYDVEARPITNNLMKE